MSVRKQASETMAGRQIRIFISSPSDVADERRRAAIVINRLAHEFTRFFELTAVLWKYEPMLASGHFQDAIVRPSDADIVVMLLWSRLGTPLPERYHGIDGRAPVTGTEWEFEDALAHHLSAGVPDLLVYRKDAPGRAEFDREDQLEAVGQQWRALQAFWSRHFIGEGGGFKAAFNTFRDLDSFESDLEQHLRQLLRQRLPEVAARDEHGAITWTEGSPFRGLEAYQAEHAAIFFGREQAEKEVIEALARQAEAGTAALVVLGASGSGKSSLVRAGVIPTLTVPGIVTGVKLWRRVLFQPGGTTSDLFDRLARAVISQGLPELPEAGIDAAALAQQWRAAPAQGALPIGVGLRAAEQHAPSGAAGAPRLILLVDQLEELFTSANISSQEGADFIALLAALAGSGLVWAIATLRSDFYHRIDDVPGLRELTTGRQYSLPPARPAELGEIVRRPAAAAGLFYASDEASGLGLDAIIAEAAAQDPAALPLLSFALDELYRRDIADGGGDTLTVATYRQLGGLEGAIAERAEEVCAALPTGAVEAVLRELVTLREGQDEASARLARRVDVATTPGREQVVDAQVAARLVVSTGTSAGPVLRLAHEALIRHWPRLGELIAADREFLRVRARLLEDRDRWEAEGRSLDLLLPHGKRVAEGAEVLSARRADLDPATAEFIEVSVARDRVLSRRQLRRTQIFAGTVAVLALSAIGFGVFAELQHQHAAQSLITAQQSLARARGREGYMSLGEHRYDDAVADFREAVQIRETLIANGLTAEFERRNIAVNHRDVGNALRGKGDLPGAIAEYRISMLAFDKLVAEKPRDELLRDDQGMDHLGLGAMLAQQKDYDGARSEFAAALAILKPLVDEDPANLAWTNSLGFAHCEFGDFLLAQGDFSGAVDEFTACRQLRETLSNRQPQNTVYRSQLFYTNFRLGSARRGQGDLAASLAAFEAAEALAPQIKEGISAGELIRLEQALRMTRDEMAARDNSQSPAPADLTRPARIEVVVGELRSCLSAVGSKPAYSILLPHLRDSAFTKLQLADDRTPSPAEAQVLGAYIDEGANCKRKWLVDVDQILPESAPIRKQLLADSQAILSQLVKGQLTWGAAAQREQQLLDSANGRNYPNAMLW
jgi:eukaryotic-like serine/threonine-protein kinase